MLHRKNHKMLSIYKVWVSSNSFLARLIGTWEQKLLFSRFILSL